MKKISELMSAMRAVMEKEGDIEVLCEHGADGAVYSPSSVDVKALTRHGGRKAVIS